MRLQITLCIHIWILDACMCSIINLNIWTVHKIVSRCITITMLCISSIFSPYEIFTFIISSIISSVNVEFLFLTPFSCLFDRFIDVYSEIKPYPNIFMMNLSHTFLPTYCFCLSSWLSNSIIVTFGSRSLRLQTFCLPSVLKSSDTKLRKVQGKYRWVDFDTCKGLEK